MAQEKKVLANIEALEKRYHGIAKIIEEKKESLTEKEKLSVVWETALNGEKILKVTTEDRELYLAGRRSPDAHARNQIALLGKIVPTAPVLIVGMGNQHYLEHLLKETDESISVLLYEPVFTIFYKQLERIDVEALFGKRTIALVIGGINDDELEPTIDAMLVGDKIALLKHFALPNYEHLALQQVKDFYKYANEKAFQYELYVNTGMRYNNYIADNIYHNVRYVLKGYTVSQLDEVLPRNVPAIVVSAGPSLNNNIKELKRAKGHAFIIAADTALKPLLREGIVPDMYAMLDGLKPLKLVEVDDARKIPMISTIGGAHKILDYHQGKIFFMDEGFHYIEKMYSKYNKKFWGMQIGGSVATLAFSLVCHLGFDKIAFVGQDLAYTNNRTHADGTFKEKMDEIDTSAYMNVPGNCEEKVATDKVLNDYRIWFEDFIEDWKNSYRVEFFNATEGGAKIEGTTICTLKEFIDKECSGEADFEETIKNIKPIFSEEEQKELLEYLHNTPKRIRQIGTLAKKGEKAYKRLDELCKNNNLDKKAYLKILKQIKRNTKQIMDNENYQIIISSMSMAEQIIVTSQYFYSDTLQKEGMEIARQGRLFMQLLQKYANILENFTEELLGNYQDDQDGVTE